MKTDTVKRDTVKRDTVKRDTINSIAVITSNQARLLHPLAELFAELLCNRWIATLRNSVLAIRGREGKGTAANGLRQEYGRFMARSKPLRGTEPFQLLRLKLASRVKIWSWALFTNAVGTV